MPPAIVRLWKAAGTASHWNKGGAAYWLGLLSLKAGANVPHTICVASEPNRQVKEQMRVQGPPHVAPVTRETDLLQIHPVPPDNAYHYAVFAAGFSGEDYNGHSSAGFPLAYPEVDELLAVTQALCPLVIGHEPCR